MIVLTVEFLDVDPAYFSPIRPAILAALKSRSSRSGL